MLLNIQEIFSDRQNLVASAVSTNVIDLGVPGVPHNSDFPMDRDIGPGTPIEFMCMVNEIGVADGGDTAWTVQVEIDNDEAFGSPRVVAETTIDGLVPGSRIPIRIVPDSVDQHYFRLNYIIAGTAPDITISAGITAGVQTNRSG